MGTYLYYACVSAFRASILARYPHSQLDQPREAATVSSMRRSQSRDEFLWRVRTVTLAAAALIAGTALVLFAASELLVLLAGLIFGAVIAAGATQLSHRFALPYHGAFTLIWTLLIGVPVLFYAFTLGPISEQIGEFGDRLATLGESAAQVPAWLPASAYLEEQLAGLAPRELISELIFAGELGGAAATVLEAVASVVVLIFIAFFISLTPRLYVEGFLRLLPARYAADTREELAHVSHTLLNWMYARLISMVIVFVMTYVGLVVLGIELALVLSVTAALLSFIPNIGPLLSVVPAALVAFADPAVSVVTILLLYIVIQLIESNLITPFFQQWAVSTPPALLLAVQVIAGVLFGIVGILLAGPLAAVAIALWGDLADDARTEPAGPRSWWQRVWSREE